MPGLMRFLPVALLCWWGAFSVWGAALTVYDKIAAKRRPKKRVRERTLLTVAFFGGAELMLAVMLLIRHKTRHKQFMLGLPGMIVLHLIAAACLLFYLR